MIFDQIGLKHRRSLGHTAQCGVRVSPSNCRCLLPNDLISRSRCEFGSPVLKPAGGTVSILEQKLRLECLQVTALSRRG